MSDAPDSSARPDRDPGAIDEYEEVDPDTIVEDAVDLFAVDDDGPPVSEADAPAPPG